MADTGAGLGYAGADERPLRLANHLRAVGAEPGRHLICGPDGEELGEIAAAHAEPEDHMAPERELGAEVLEWLEGRISKFKMPRRIRVVDALPRTPTGRLVRRRLDPSLART